MNFIKNWWPKKNGVVEELNISEPVTSFVEFLKANPKCFRYQTFGHTWDTKVHCLRDSKNKVDYLWECSRKGAITLIEPYKINFSRDENTCLEHSLREWLDLRRNKVEAYNKVRQQRSRDKLTAIYKVV